MFTLYLAIFSKRTVFRSPFAALLLPFGGRSCYRFPLPLKFPEGNTDIFHVPLLLESLITFVCISSLSGLVMLMCLLFAPLWERMRGGPYWR
jgi:hypothetical protein